MNKDIIEGHWKEVKGSIKQQWAKLTDDDIAHMKGTYEELQGSLQKRYGYEKDRAEKEINEFITRQHWRDDELE